MTMWRDEFLARERISERERAVREGARVRNLLSRGLPPETGVAPDGGAARRAVARLLAAGAHGAMAVARRLDAGVDVEPTSRRSGTAPG